MEYPRPSELTLENLAHIVQEETNLNIDGFAETDSFSDSLMKNGLPDDMEGALQYKNICFRIEDDYGIKLRYPDEWYVWTVEKWVKWC